jgi:phosphoribosyl 1,2-cyclic phosphodiesterase
VAIEAENNPTMGLHFKSIRSSSSGNCLQIWTKHSQIVIDCGFKTQWECKEFLKEHAERPDDLNAVLVTHAHTDHISEHSLKVLASLGVRIKAHARVAKQICSRHACEDWNEPPFLDTFADFTFQLGDLRITPMEVPHAPDVPNFGFVIEHGDGRRRRKIVVCTDFYYYADVLHHFVNADLIFVESNHDLDLLRKRPNYASRYHLSNPKTAWLLYRAIRKSKKPPQAVMLGHLSHERNCTKLALGMVEEIFDRQGMDIDFDLVAAPLFKPSETVRIE